MTKVITTRDQQAISLFGVGASVASSFASAVVEQAATAAANSITASGAGAHVLDDAAGQMLLANTSADWSGTVLYGVVQAVDASIAGAPHYTVDRWYTITGLPSGGTPSIAAGNHFVVLPVAPPFLIAALSDTTSPIGGGETGAAIGGVELTTNGLGRKPITSIARGVGSTALSLSTTFSYTGGPPQTGATSQNIGRAALVNSIVAGKNALFYVNQVNGGNPAQVTNLGDQFTPTWNVVLG